MSAKNMKLRKLKLVIATTLTLLLSVAQSSETRVSQRGMDRIASATGDFGVDFERGLPSRFRDLDESSFPDDSNAGVILSRTDRFGEMSVTEIRTSESTRTQFNFKSNATEELHSATLLVKNKHRVKGENRSTFLDRTYTEDPGEHSTGPVYSLSFNLPSGQILLENDTLSIMTASDFSRTNLSENAIRGSVDGHFALLLNDVIRDSDMSGFSLSMAESLAESDMFPPPFLGTHNYKGENPQIEGAWGCAGALIVLAAANGALAAAIGGTYATLGILAATIAGAVSAVGVAMVAVDMYCLQKSAGLTGVYLNRSYSHYTS